ncbi:alpha/beta fold hydrolase [Halomonas binhaiensis]|uniref:Alpha/beta fold hydrolase n=1 Tax=Halomonas binhaiensis TaxID=2562282 RepID=A0A5C1NMS7_9GAMM|nr:alpha/beta fold hydrolase [Halomonas binhaiensis]QEM83738.1 alpha/beta fold hydrolase [Halomonas binhaiensis]
MRLQDHRLPGLHLVDHRIEVPLDWSRPESGETIEVFFREVCHINQRDADLPLLVYLQGGPGGKSPRPSENGPGWLLEAVKHFRVILPDQRGTGRSSRITATTMAAFDSPEAGADYLACFDTHAIIADLEHIRNEVYGGVSWQTLGQSYGGFLTLSYLSWAPQGLERCLVTGGIPSLTPDADKVYRLTYQRVLRKMSAFRANFPEDGPKLDAIADFIQQHQPRLPNGDPLTVRRFQTLGMLLGMGDGAERLHWLLEEAFTDDSQQELNHHFLVEVMHHTGFDENPLYAAIHEHIYATPDTPCDWAAQRQREQHSEFAESHRPLQLTGEMIYPWMFDEIHVLKPFRDAVHCLAQRRLSRPFYDPERLANNQIPVAALIYFDDMYVDAKLSVASAEAIGNLRYWITNEYEHDGLRQDDRVFKRLGELIANAS